MTEVEAKVDGARLFVRNDKSSDSGKKKRTVGVTRVAEAFVSIDKLAIAAEGVTCKGKNCKITTDPTQLTVKRLSIIAQTIIIQPL